MLTFMRCPVCGNRAFFVQGPEGDVIFYVRQDGVAISGGDMQTVLDIDLSEIACTACPWRGPVSGLLPG